MKLEHCGICYELQKKTYVPPLVEQHPHRTLFQCYERPSQTKVTIYNFWAGYTKNINAQGFKVASYNTNVFTLEFDFYKNRTLFHARITPRHNYLFKHDYQPLL